MPSGLSATELTCRTPVPGSGKVRTIVSATVAGLDARPVTGREGPLELGFPDRADAEPGERPAALRFAVPLDLWPMALARMTAAATPPAARMTAAPRVTMPERRRLFPAAGLSRPLATPPSGLRPTAGVAWTLMPADPAVVSGVPAGTCCGTAS